MKNGGSELAWFDDKPDEELQEVPEWRLGREVIEDELEDVIEKPPYFCTEVWKG
jgi:hypothetical protein